MENEFRNRYSVLLVYRIMRVCGCGNVAVLRDRYALEYRSDGRFCKTVRRLFLVST